MSKPSFPEGVLILPALEEEILKFYGRMPEQTFKAWSFFWRRELVAIAGFVKDAAGFTLFSDFKPEYEIPKTTKWRAIRHFMEIVDECGLPFYSAPDNTLPGAPAMLQRLGFEDTGRVHEGNKVYWRGKP